MKRPYRKRFAVLAMFLALLCVSAPAFAGGQTGQDDGEALFARGISEYRLERFDAARSDFLRVIESTPASARVPAAHVMLAKALFRGGMFAPADSVVKSLRLRYPGSPYVDWTYYMESACALRTGNTDRSLSLLAWLAGNAHDTKVKSRSLRALAHTLTPLAGSERVTAALARNGADAALLAAAEPYDVEDIFSTEDEIRPAKTPAAKEVNPPAKKPEAVRIGLIAPTSGANAAMGNQLLRGVRAAIPESLILGGEPVQLIVEDSGSEPVSSVLAARKLAELGVVAIIGPVYSIPSISAAVESNAHGIPFIAPTATDAGLAEIGKYVFQLNFSPVIEGEKLADLAVNTLGVRSVAVIASRDSWGEDVSAAFTRAVKKQGVNVVHTAFFKPDFETDEDAKIVRDIRDRAAKSPAFTDSVVARFGLPDSTGREFRYYSSRDLNDLNTLDAIFVSATPSDAIRFASRIMQYSIDTILLGDSGWNTPNIPEDGKQFVDGAYLVAPTGELSGGRGAFFLGTDARNNDRGTVAMKGYDAGAILVRCLRNGARTPEEITRALGTVRDYEGASSRITIDPARRLNTAVEFVRIQDQKYEMISPVR